MAPSSFAYWNRSWDRAGFVAPSINKEMIWSTPWSTCRASKRTLGPIGSKSTLRGPWALIGPENCRRQRRPGPEGLQGAQGGPRGPQQGWPQDKDTQISKFLWQFWKFWIFHFFYVNFAGVPQENQNFIENFEIQLSKLFKRIIEDDFKENDDYKLCEFCNSLEITGRT